MSFVKNRAAREAPLRQQRVNYLCYFSLVWLMPVLVLSPAGILFIDFTELYLINCLSCIHAYDTRITVQHDV